MLNKICKYFSILVIITNFLFPQCFASQKQFANIYSNTYSINILEKNYYCCNNNCYDFDSLYYNKFVKISHINMIIDLMKWNAHQEYLSPYNDGYISHLIFQLKLKNNKLEIKCKGFVVGDVVVNYKDGQAFSANYKIIAVHKGKPMNKEKLTEFEDAFYDWIDENSLLEVLKTW